MNLINPACESIYTFVFVLCNYFYISYYFNYYCLVGEPSFVCSEGTDLFVGKAQRNLRVTI